MCLLYTTTDNFSKSLFAYVLDFWIGKNHVPKENIFLPWSQEQEQDITARPFCTIRSF